MSSLAEAGYLAGLLRVEGLPVWVRQQDDFSAVTGAWSSVFVLQTLRGDADRVSAVLRRESNEIDQEDLGDDEASEREPLERVIWRPVALMAIAGMASFWLGQRVANQAEPSGPERLAAAMQQAGRPFVARGEGLTSRWLTFEPLSQSWCLETDANGDGRVDGRQWFSLEE
ncbi:hypothetical protein [Pirellulimonas nuda]|uniref:hypothetical protein n=1 Tax=Pirellulimonas nuda TaxID=2528009 RepID=UPI001E38049B|nr:hypothetical protein [Pirellulimonas nuda]